MGNTIPPSPNSRHGGQIAAMKTKLTNFFWVVIARVADTFQVLGVQGVGTMLGSFALPAYAAWATDWLRVWGPISWVACGFAGLVLSLISLQAWSRYRLNSESAKIASRLGAEGDAVNPLLDNFDRKRIRLQMMASVIDRTIDQKTFDRCELLGPICVVITDGIVMQDNILHGCDFVAVQPGRPINNAVRLRRCTIQRCKLHGITFLMPPDAVALPGLAGANWITNFAQQQAQPP